MTEEACIAAAANGHALCLRTAVQAGAPLCKEVCEAAALHGHGDCLYEAHSYNCPWDEKTFAYANWSRSSACISYLRENNCPWHAHFRWYIAFITEAVLVLYVARLYPLFVLICLAFLIAVQLHSAADLLGLYMDPNFCLFWYLLRFIVLVAARVYTLALIAYGFRWFTAAVSPTGF